MKKLSDKSRLSAYFMGEKELADYVFLPHIASINYNNKYDIGLLFGCKDYNIMSKRIIKAYELYKLQVLDKLLLTGGVGFFSKNKEETESSVMRKELLKLGVQDSDIIVEDKSKDTYQNMKNSMKYIKEYSNDSTSIVTITSDFHSKRVKGLLDNMTDLDTYYFGTKDGVHDYDMWYKSTKDAKKLIRLEALMLAHYVKKGLIQDQEIITRGLKIK